MSKKDNGLAITQRVLWAVLPLVMILAFTPLHAKTGDGWLGVYITEIDEDLRAAEDLPSTEGVMIAQVVKDSPAEKAGLKRGDVVLKYGDKDVVSTRRFTRMIEWTEPGEERPLIIRRKGKEMTIKVKVAEAPESDLTVWSWERGDRAFDVPRPPDAPVPPRAHLFSLGQLSTSRIGVSLSGLSDQLAKAYGAPDGGALITEVEKDGPAEKAGLKAGDVIVDVDRTKVSSVGQIRELIQKRKDGEKVTVRVLRPLENTDLTVDVEVEETTTWSGFGDGWYGYAPRAGRVEVPRFDTREWRAAERELRDALRESGGEWRDELREELEELREQLKELQKELRSKGR